jgi:deazaflavin-dependent oxidoreductase (nitroreductase family)
LKADPDVEIRDGTEVYSMRAREVVDPAEKQRLWDIAVEAYPPYREYQEKTDRVIPVFIAEAVK